MWEALGVFAYRDHSLIDLFIQYVFIEHIEQGLVLYYENMKINKIDAWFWRAHRLMGNNI